MRLQVGDKVEFAKEYYRGFVIFDRGTKAIVSAVKGTDVVVCIEKTKHYFGWTSAGLFRKV